MQVFKKVDLEKIKFLRKDADLSLEDMANFLGYESLNGYYYLEIGRGKFSAENLAKVADKFKVPIAELFTEEEIAGSASSDIKNEISETAEELVPDYYYAGKLAVFVVKEE